MKGTLSPERLAVATRIGKERHARRGQTFVDVSTDVNVACAECAVSVATNRRWNGEFHGVAAWKCWRQLESSVNGLTVKTTSFVLGELLVGVDDPDDHVYVLVIDRDHPTFSLVGWMFGKDAKQAKYWNESESLMPSYLVPQADLKPCWDLRVEPEGKGDRKKDPAPDFGGTGRFPQRRTADDGRPAAEVSHLVRSRFALPCCRCQQMIPAGSLSGGDRVTGTIHGDPTECKRRRAG